MKCFFTILLFALLFSACGDDSYIAPMCACASDEICVEEECKPLPSDVVPAPKDSEKKDE